MMNKQAKREYDSLLKSGELLEMFEDFTGSWRKDKKAFLQYWENNQEVLNDLDVYLDFEEDEFL